MKTVFVDSSVLFSAVNSPSGGSSKLLILKNLRLITSPVVLTETERNVRKKLQSYHLERFFSLVNLLTIKDQIPNDTLVEKAKKVIVEKDAVILAEAKHAKTHYLVTLDTKHFFTTSASAFLKPQKIVTPKMLIELIENDNKE